MSSSSSVSIHALLKKTEHYDKDERYMATSDLCEVLKRQHNSHSNTSSTSHPSSSAGGGGGGLGGLATTNSRSQSQSQTSHILHLDPSTERKICTAVLRLLHDKSNDVQAIAVKTLGVLLTTVQEEQVLEIADSLADQVLDASKSELRDVYAIGLRTLVKTIPSSMGDRTSARLVGRLLEGILSIGVHGNGSGSGKGSGTGNATASSNNSNAQQQPEEIGLACLDILTDLLGRFGATAVSVTRQHEPILQMCLQQLVNDQYSSQHQLRKRAGNTLGCLSVVLSDALLISMVERLLTQIDSTKTNKGDTRALIRTMCTVSGAVGHRLGQAQIDRILPIFLRFTNPQDAITGDDQDSDDNENGSDNHEDHQGNDNEAAQDIMDDQDDTATALANELRESCFMGFESFVLRCPTQVEPHLQKIIQAALAYMAYDPNYSYGEEEEEEDAMESNNDDDNEDFEDEENEFEEEEEEDDDDDDDDDSSWKVRRSAIRALKAVVETKKHDPSALWTQLHPVRKGKSAIVAAALVTRFKEREENCRVGVIDCFTRLLSVTVTAAAAGVVSFAHLESISMMMDANTNANANANTVVTTVIDLRTKYAPSLVKACEKLLAVKKGGDRSKSNALALLSTLCKAPGGVGGQQEIMSVFQHVQSFLAGVTGDYALHREASSKTLRLDALSLVHAMLACDNHDPVHIRQGLYQSLLPQLCQAVQEQWYKVIAQALRALAAVPRFFVIGYTGNDDVSAKKQEMDAVAKQLYTAMEPLLAAHDVDQEIKECALTACASLLSALHSSLDQSQTTRLLDLLLERLKNETTRIAAIKTLSAIAGSALVSDKNAMEEDTTTTSNSKVDLTPILADSISTMASFLKLQSRSLKQSSLEALDTVVTNHGVADSEELYAMVLQELSHLVVDSDLHISHLSLRTSISALKVCPACGPAVKEHVLPNALVLSTSPLLQDLALDSLLALLEQIVTSSAVDFHDLLAMLRGRLDQAGGKHAIYNLAKCIAVITAATTPENRQGVVSETLSSLEGTNTPKEPAELKSVQLALLVSGDLGRIVDLGTMGGVADRLQSIYMGYFESPSEDLKYAAAYALGRASVGAQSVFLPAIVDALANYNQKKQYLLLSALRGFIQCSYQQSGGDSIAASLPVIMPHLETHCSDVEEGVRTMVAECLGSLTCMQPALMLQKLQQLVTAHSGIVATNGSVDPEDAASKQNALVCWTVATSIKLSIAGKADPTVLAQYMPGFLKLLQQTELSVRNAALLMVYSAVHHMPQVVSGLMDLILPSLYEVAEFKLERKVDLGPFTHTVDDALPLRKASLSIFATCLENLPASLDIAAFMPVLAKALGDVEDVQLQAHQIAISMCLRQPTYLVAAVETFVDPLEKTLHKKQGQKTGTELERLNEWIKSALRAMVALSKLEGAMNSRKFAEFCERTRVNGKFRPILDALEEER